MEGRGSVRLNSGRCLQTQKRVLRHPAKLRRIAVAQAVKPRTGRRVVLMTRNRQRDKDVAVTEMPRRLGNSASPARRTQRSADAREDAVLGGGMTYIPTDEGCVSKCNLDTRQNAIAKKFRAGSSVTLTFASL